MMNPVRAMNYKQRFKVKIYGLNDSIDHKTVYVGKTVLSLKRRLGLHITKAKQNKTKKDKWILRLLANGLKPEIILLDEVPNYKANHKEKKFIKLINSEISVNGNNGGGGNNGKGFKRNQMPKGNFRAHMESSDYSKSTIINYIRYVDKFIDGTHNHVKYPKDITSLEIQDYLSSIKENSLRNGTISALKIFYTYIMKQPLKLQRIKYEY